MKSMNECTFSSAAASYSHSPFSTAVSDVISTNGWSAAHAVLLSMDAYAACATSHLTVGCWV